jgi:RNA polymerase sigma-70 factor (ECF subfamily)
MARLSGDADGRSGDTRASVVGTARQHFEAEALPHIEAVYRFALRLAGSPDAAEDLVQETYLRAWRAWAQYTPGTRPRSWLFTICRNVFLRSREREQRHERVVGAEAPRQDAGGGGPAVVNPVWSATNDTDPEGTFFAELLDEAVLDAVDELPEEYRTAVILSDLEGLGYQEIAEVMDVPVGTVKSRLFRGRRRLQKRLYEYAVEMGYIMPRGESV